jgi:hypothetical protein
MKKHFWVMVTAVAAAAMMSSCSHYYKAVSIPVNSNLQKATAIDSLQKAARTLILRNGSDAYLITHPEINKKSGILQCTLDSLPEKHRLHLTKGRRGKMKYYRKPNEISEQGDKAVLTEVHIYTDTIAHISTGAQEISLNSIRQIEVIAKDSKRTTNSYVLGSVITVAGIAVIGLAIFLATFDFTLFPGP